MKQTAGQIWKLRMVKSYPEAHNHVLIGRTVEVTDAYVKMHCRTFHFGRNVDGTKDVMAGDVGVRLVAWYRVEIVNELAASFDYVQAKLVCDDTGGIVFRDDQHDCGIYIKHDRGF